MDLENGLARYAKQPAPFDGLFTQRRLRRGCPGGDWLFSQEPGSLGRGTIARAARRRPGHRIAPTVFHRRRRSLSFPGWRAVAGGEFFIHDLFSPNRWHTARTDPRFGRW